MSHTVVDLTSSSPSGELPPQSSFPWEERQRHPQSSQLPHTIKRRRLNDSSVGPSSASSSSVGPMASRSQQFNVDRQHIDLDDIEAVDLTDGNNKTQISKTLSKQQEDAVKAQQHQMTDSGDGRSILAAYKCPVCMDTPEDATSTICGHVFCHKCIIDTLRFGEERRVYEGHNKAPRGNCPVCRKPLSRVDNPGPRRNLVPLQLKLTTKPRS